MKMVKQTFINAKYSSFSKKKNKSLNSAFSFHIHDIWRHYIFFFWETYDGFF